MAGAASKDDFFDVRKIRRLVELLKEYDLSEIDLQQGETRIQLRRGGEPAAMVLGARPAFAAPEAALPPVETPRPAPAPSAEPKPEADYVVAIRSPMVGTFYSTPDPDSPAYVTVGDQVGPESVVCIVEAMKVFNQIPAEVSGKIVAVLVENGEPVEYGQPMFKVDTRQ
jgi:acetyl-CoA carboxylase biotin carboxyl carrier protein